MSRTLDFEDSRNLEKDYVYAYPHKFINSLFGNSEPHFTPSGIDRIVKFIKTNGRAPYGVRFYSENIANKICGKLGSDLYKVEGSIEFFRVVPRYYCGD